MIKIKIKTKLNENPYGFPEEIEDKTNKINLDLPEVFKDVIDFSFENQPKDLVRDIYKINKFSAPFNSVNGKRIYIKFNTDGDAIEASYSPFDDVPSLTDDWMDRATKHNLPKEASTGNWHSSNEIPPEGHGLEEKRDKCYEKAKRKYADDWPSAYAGGYIARCRQKKGNIKESSEAALEDGTPVCKACLLEYILQNKNILSEAKYRGRTVSLGKPMKGDVKKFKVYVRDPKTGNVKKVNFGDKKMRIKKSNPKRRKSFRARHRCENPGPKTKARYWSCRKW